MDYKEDKRPWGDYFLKKSFRMLQITSDMGVVSAYLKIFKDFERDINRINSKNKIKFERR